MNKSLRIVGIIVLLLAVGFFAMRKYTKSFSPEAVAEYHKVDVDVKVTYGRPSKKGRFIFGREQDNALLPYGKVWRTGANEATLIEFGSGLTLGGKPVKSGTYSLYTIPGQSSWKIILNAEVGQWGTEYNDGKDLLSVDVPIRVRPTIQELFNIYFEDTAGGANMILSWDQTEAIVPIVHQ